MNKEAKAAIDEVNEMFKDKSLVMRLGDSKSMDVERTPCGILSIDSVFGGGTPNGRIIELYGAESSGKTTIALHILASYKRHHPKKEIAFIDFEHAFDPNYAQNLGIDTKELVISQPMYAEQGLEVISKLISSNGYSCVVVDSVAAMSPEAEIKGEMGKASIGTQARLMSQAMRKLTGIANKTKTTVIFINQTREKIGIMFGSPVTTSGGNALKFYASIRAEIFRGSKTKDSDKDVVGNRGKIKTVKNKTYPPYRECEFDIGFGTGISKYSDILEFAVDLGIIVKSGSWYSLDDTKLGQGRAAASDVLEENVDLYETLEKRIYKELFKSETT